MIDHLRDKGFGVELPCRLLGLSASAHYARRSRPPSARARRDAWLTRQIRRVFEANWWVYGARRITRALRREGIHASHGTVERLMRAAGLRGVKRGRGRRTTIVDPSAPRPSDLVNRQFSASRPDQLWVADLTYVATTAGWVYVALVTDVFSRAIVGWQVADHLRTDLPLEALQMAIGARLGNVHHGRIGAEQVDGQGKYRRLIHHSDRGCQYVSFRYADQLTQAGITASVGSVGDSYDNALAEALNGTLKAELIEPHGPWSGLDEVWSTLIRWVGWYNHHRLHSAIGYLPPVEYEANWNHDQGQSHTG